MGGGQKRLDGFVISVMEKGSRGSGPKPICVYALLLSLPLSTLECQMSMYVQMSAKELCKSEKAIAKKLPRVD